MIEDPASHQVTADIAAAPQVSEHFLLLSESKTYEDGSPMNFIPIVMAFDWTHVTNGQVNPTYHFKKGETVHFRAVNAGVEPPMFLSIEGHELLPYARDGFPIPSPQVTDTVRIGAGMRSEFLVKFDTPGTYRFVRVQPISVSPENSVVCYLECHQKLPRAFHSIRKIQLPALWYLKKR